jgi:hypothetical protein
MVLWVVIAVIMAVSDGEVQGSRHVSIMFDARRIPTSLLFNASAIIIALSSGVYSSISVSCRKVMASLVTASLSSLIVASYRSG